MRDYVVDPGSTIAISSRVRLARNYVDVPFPCMMDESMADEVITRTDSAIQGCPDKDQFHLARMAQLPPYARQELVERHLISPELAAKDGAAVLLGRGEAISVMINEEDHLRIQALLPGLQLHQAMELANEVDDWIEGCQRYAFDPAWGYLTSCPTNTGTGMRASVMLHLPALSMLSQMGPIIRAVAQIGLTVRGMYGEGSEASGNLYQLSNQITLGRNEEEILRTLSDAAQQVMEREMSARAALAEHNALELEDRLMRSWGVFINARKMDTKEFMQRLSDARFAADMGYLNLTAETLNQLMLSVQPAALTRQAGRELTGTERDVQRARRIREILLKTE